MFDKLWEILGNIWHELNPFFIVEQYQEAILLRMGKFHKVCKPGLHFKIPLFDNYIKQHTVQTTLSLHPQSLVTKDEVNIVVKGMVKYKIGDVKVFILEVFDAVDAISDVSQGIIKDVIMNKTFQECRAADIDSAITRKIKSELKKMGVEILQVTLTDIAPIRSIRLISDSLHAKILE